MSEPLAAGGRRWARIAYQGHFRGHHAGVFALTATVFEEITRNFRARGLPVPIDLNHASEDTERTHLLEVASAKGWVRALRINDGDLWGECEVYEPELSAVRSGRLPYLSPAVRFECRDPVTGAKIGARLTSVALTTQPFLSRQAPLALSDGARRATPPGSAPRSPSAPSLSFFDLADRLRRAGYSNDAATNLAFKAFHGLA